MRSAGSSPASASVSRCAAKAAWSCERLDSSAAYVLAKLSHAAGTCRQENVCLFECRGFRYMQSLYACHRISQNESNACRARFKPVADRHCFQEGGHTPQQRSKSITLCCACQNSEPEQMLQARQQRARGAAPPSWRGRGACAHGCSSSTQAPIPGPPAPRRPPAAAACSAPAPHRAQFLAPGGAMCNA